VALSAVSPTLPGSRAVEQRKGEARLPDHLADLPGKLLVVNLSVFLSGIIPFWQKPVAQSLGPLLPGAPQFAPAAIRSLVPGAANVTPRRSISRPTCAGARMRARGQCCRSAVRARLKSMKGSLTVDSEMSHSTEISPVSTSFRHPFFGRVRGTANRLLISRKSGHASLVFLALTRRFAPRPARCPKTEEKPRENEIRGVLSTNICHSVGRLGRSCAHADDA
jgi:hypothetical protein